MEHDYVYCIKGQRVGQSAKFWMVVGDGNSPKVRHESYQSASKEASRLASANPGTTFYVLETVESLVQPSGVVKTKL
jgi:hypothetical protein